MAIDVRWLKNRHKVLSKVYVSPTYARAAARARPPTGIVALCAERPAADVELIGLGEIDGPEDVILDDDDNIYCRQPHGDIVRFFAPDYTRQEVFAHIGGRPLGMAFARDGRCCAASAAWGSTGSRRTARSRS